MQNSFHSSVILFLELKIIAYIVFGMWRFFPGSLKSHPYLCYTQDMREHLALCFICIPVLYAAP